MPRKLMKKAGVGAVAGLALGILWLARGEEEPRLPPPVVPEATASPSRASSLPGRETTSEDSNVRAARFREQVLEELARSGPSVRERGPSHRTASAIRPDATSSVGYAPHPIAGYEGRMSWERRSPQEVLTPADHASANWEYLEDVYAGRISGIPSEQRAGVSLRQMDEMGSIPYVEELREDLRIDELEELGLVDPPTEPTRHPWPICVRTGTCRKGDAL